MKKSTELLQKKAEIMDKMKALTEAGKIDEAHALIADKAQVEKEIDLALAMENEDKTPINAEPAGKVIDQTKLANRAFNKAILGRRLTEDEAKLVVEDVAGTPGQVGATPEKGGYLLRDGQMNQLKEFRRELKPLKNYCNVVSVNARSGSQPTITDDSLTLTNFDELNAITEKDIDFGQISYAVKDYGEIIPCSNTLLADTDIDVVGVIGKRFAHKAVRTENGKIIELLKTLSPTVGTGYKDIIKALNVTLDPALKEGTKIFTNQNGLNYLDTLEDGNGRPMLTQDLTDATVYRFKGYEVVVISNAVLPDQATNLPFFIGNMSEFIMFFDRQQVAIAVSTEAGFAKNATLLRAIERFDVKKADTKAMVYVQLPQGK